MAAFSPAHVLAQDATAFDWSGFYAGAVAGGLRTTGGVAMTYPAAGTQAPAGGYSFSGNSLLGGTAAETGLPALFALNQAGSVVGVEAGYNRQIGHFVFGLEGDFTRLASPTHDAGTSDSGLTTVSIDTSLDALTLRGRAGIAVDRLLFFATAGLAVGHTTLDTDLNYADGAKNAFAHGSAHGLVPGIVIGAGGEYAVNDNVSIKAEGLYYRFAGTTTATATGSGTTISGGNPVPAGVQPYSATYDPEGFAARVGLNFHF
jgi:outer membrane immunogenic protein